MVTAAMSFHQRRRDNDVTRNGLFRISKAAVAAYLKGNGGPLKKLVYRTRTSMDAVTTESVLPDTRSFGNQVKIETIRGLSIGLACNGTIHITGIKSFDEDTLRGVLGTIEFLMNLIPRVDGSVFSADLSDLRLDSTIYQIEHGTPVIEKGMKTAQFEKWGSVSDEAGLFNWVGKDTLSVYLYYNQNSSEMFCDCGENTYCGFGTRYGTKMKDCKVITVAVYRTGFVKIYAMNSVACIEAVFAFVTNELIPMFKNNLV